MSTIPSPNNGLQAPTGATGGAAVSLPGQAVNMDPTQNVFVHMGTSINIYPYSTTKSFNRFDNVSGNSTLDWVRQYTGYDVIKRQLKVHYVLKVQRKTTSDTSIYQDYPKNATCVADYIEPYPDGFNNLIENLTVTNDGSTIELNNTRENWIVNQLGRTHDLANHATTYNGKGDGSYWDYQYVNQPRIPSTAGGISAGSSLPLRKSSKLLSSNTDYALFYCTDYIANGLFLAQGDSEQEQGLTNINQLNIRMKLNANFNDLARISNLMISPWLAENAGVPAQWDPTANIHILNHFDISIHNVTMEVNYNCMDTRMQLKPTISQRPFTAIRSHYEPITKSVNTYNFLDKATYPSDKMPATVSIFNYQSNFQFSHLILGVQKIGRNADLVGIGGSPFTITNASISTSSQAEQLKFFNNATLAELTESNSAWWPTNKFDIEYSTVPNIIPDAPDFKWPAVVNFDANKLAHTEDMHVPAAGSWVVLNMKDYTQGRVTTDGLIARYSLNINVGLALHSSATAPLVNTTTLDTDPTHYQLVMILVIPSILGIQNNLMTLQLGTCTEANLSDARNQLVADPSLAGVTTVNLGASVRMNSSSLTASGGGWRDWFKKGKNAISNVFKNAVADPIGTFNKAKDTWTEGRSIYEAGKNLASKWTGSGKQPSVRYTPYKNNV